MTSELSFVFCNKKRLMEDSSKYDITSQFDEWVKIERLKKMHIMECFGIKPQQLKRNLKDCRKFNINHIAIMMQLSRETSNERILNIFKEAIQQHPIEASPNINDILFLSSLNVIDVKEVMKKMVDSIIQEQD